MSESPLVDPWSSSPKPPAKRRSWPIVLGALALTATVASVAVVATLTLRPPTISLLPPAETTTTVVEPTPDVVLAIKHLARLETTTYHLERVVDLADNETRAYGLVHVKDSILLVAVGDVVAGCDLAQISADDVDADWDARSVTVTLPAPTVFSARLDDKATRVFSRHTDVLASRHEDLEGRARQEATRTMEKAALDAGVLDKARAGAEGPIRSLLEAAGFKQVTIKFR